VSFALSSTSDAGGAREGRRSREAPAVSRSTELPATVSSTLSDRPECRSSLHEALDADRNVRPVDVPPHADLRGRYAQPNIRSRAVLAEPALSPQQVRRRGSFARRATPAAQSFTDEVSTTRPNHVAELGATESVR